MPQETDRLVKTPFRVTPRLDPKPWGGHRLARYGYELTGETGEADPLGEVLLTTDQATIADGPLAGRTLGEAMSAAPESLAGRLGLAATGHARHFPLLTKLIDASQNLSIQVHPDDSLASSFGSLGKTEAWYVLEAEAESALYIGLRNPAEAEAFLQDCVVGDGRAAHYLNVIPATAHQTLILPAGTVHALGAGVVVYEVQQPSAMTFRLDDWGRVGADGKPRDRHLAEGKAALKPELRPCPLAPLPLRSDSDKRCILTACRYFALERINLVRAEAVKIIGSHSAHVLTVISGTATLASDAGQTDLGRGQTGMLPAAAGEGMLAATEPSVVLHAWVPDLPRDIVAPLRQAGASDTQIAALSGSLPDLADALNSAD